MFKIGQIVICVDSVLSAAVLPSGSPETLQHMKQYIVDDYSDGFVILEGVKGEWHETRFVAVEVAPSVALSLTSL